MTHAEKELERLKDAFDKWSITRFQGHGQNPKQWTVKDGAELTADIFFPFVAYALSDMQGSAEKIAMLNKFKAALGMELMAHEKYFGVDE